MGIIQEALDFEANSTSFKTRDEKIIGAIKVKELILGLNDIYKETKETEIMDQMKRLTAIKQKLEKRL